MGQSKFLLRSRKKYSKHISCNVIIFVFEEYHILRGMGECSEEDFLLDRSGHRKVPKAADTCLLARLPLPTVSATLSRAGISREGKDHAQGWLCPAHTHHPVRPGSARPPQVWHAFCPRVPEASDGTDTEDPQQGQGQPVAKESHHNEQRLTPHRSPTSSKGLLGPSSGKRLRKHTAQRCKATILQ